MKTFYINGITIELDETKTYLDFYLIKGEPQLKSIDFEKMLQYASEDKLKIDAEFKTLLEYLKRWTVEAPRKRGYRQMKRDGMIVLSGEYFFENDEGEEIINNLENTGILTEYLLEKLY